MKITVSILDKLEARIQNNVAPSLESLVQDIATKDVPRHLLARFANLVKRMGGTKYALRLLNGVVRRESQEPTPSEIIEYSSCLSRLGLANESITLLRGLKEGTNPEISFELAVAYMWNWDYPLAISHLERYLQFPNIPAYKRCVGTLNLGASLVYTNQLKKAELILNELLVKVKNLKFEMLHGNALELLGVIALQRKKFETAERYFLSSKEKLHSFQPRYRMYADKGLVILKMLRENGSPESLKQCLELRMRASKIEDWNTLREMELYKAIVTNDEYAISSLYCGVSQIEYRKRILSLWGRNIKVGKIFERKIGPQTSAKPPRVFDVTKGKDISTGSQFKAGQNLHRLLQVLTSDFYAPFSTPQLFSLVYRGLFFNPDSSPQQVYESVKRLNEWFDAKKIPLRVHRSLGGYRLRAEQPYILRISTGLELLSKTDNFLENLNAVGIEKEFTVTDVQQKLEIPRRSATRILGECVAEGKLLRIGKGCAARYSLLKLKKAA